MRHSNWLHSLLTLHKKWSFPLRISSVNVTKCFVVIIDDHVNPFHATGLFLYLLKKSEHHRLSVFSGCRKGSVALNWLKYLSSFKCCFCVDSSLKNFFYFNILALTWSQYLGVWVHYNQGGIYLLKVNNRSSRKSCEICSNLTITIPERRQWHPYC